jgi:hypothetical protein
LLQEIPESDSREVELRNKKEGHLGYVAWLWLQMAGQNYGLLERHMRWPDGSMIIDVSRLFADEEHREVAVSTERSRWVKKEEGGK